MNFLTVSFLIAGAAAALIPIVLHLLMKGRPKQIEFPALLFIRKTITRNQRRYTLKHLLLLTLRILLLIGIGLLLARPSFRAESFSASPGSKTLSALTAEKAPAAVALVIDTSVRMNRSADNRSRLDEAKDLALTILSRLPAESEAAVIRSGPEQDSFQIDLLAARKAIQDLTINSPARSLPDSITAAVRLLQNSKFDRRELFVITDKSAESWPGRQKENLLRLLDGIHKNKEDGRSDLNICLLDCRPEEKNAETFFNSSLLNSGLSAETVALNTSVRLETELAHTGAAKEKTVELSLLPLTKIDRANATKENSPKIVSNNSSNTNQMEDPRSKNTFFFDRAEKKASRSVSFPKGDSRRTVSFQITGLKPGFYQGALRFSSPDALADDNIRWFSFEIKRDAKILIAAPDPADQKTLFLREALAPAELRKIGSAPFDPQTVSLTRFEKMSAAELEKYQVIFLLDPDRRLADRADDLLAFVRNGGGLGIFFGRHAPAPALQSETVRELIGGRISQQVRVPDWTVHLSPRGYENGVLTAFRSFSAGTEIPWSALTVGRYWHFTDLSEQAVRLIDYSDGRPALFTRSIGNGTVLTGTFPLSDLPGDAPWNMIPTGDTAWIFLVMIDGAARHLIAGRTSCLNYLTGEPVILRADGEKIPDKAAIDLPNGQKIELTAEKDQARIQFPRAGQTGHYQIETADGPVFPAGFSVNYSPAEFNLTPCSPTEIESFFPKDSVRWITGNEDFESVRTRQRIGRELYPILLLLLTGLIAFEWICSNRFYKN